MIDYRLRSMCVLDNVNGKGRRVLRLVFKDKNNPNDVWNYDMAEMEKGVSLENVMANLEEAQGMLECYLNDQKRTEE